MYLKLNDVGCNERAMEKVHRVLNNKDVKNIKFAFKSTGKLNLGMSKLIKEAVENCDVCNRNSRSRLKPNGTIPRASDFNSVVTLDLEEMENEYVLWMVCAFTRMIKGVVLKDKREESIMKGLYSEWCLNY